MAQQELSRDAILDSLSARVTKDVAAALKYIDVHEVVGILEMIKVSIITQTLQTTAAAISKAVKGASVEN